MLVQVISRVSSPLQTSGVVFYGLRSNRCAARQSFRVDGGYPLENYLLVRQMLFSHVRQPRREYISGGLRRREASKNKQETTRSRVRPPKQYSGQYPCLSRRRPGFNSRLRSFLFAFYFCKYNECVSEVLKAVSSFFLVSLKTGIQLCRTPFLRLLSIRLFF